jgi:hypothetical protein
MDEKTDLFKLRSPRRWSGRMKNSRGMSAVEMVIYLGIGAVALAAILSLNVLIFRTQNDLASFQELQRTKNQIFRILNDNRAWENTINHPDNSARFNCFLKKESCKAEANLPTPPPGQPKGIQFGLLDQTNQKVMVSGDPATPGTGIDERGNPCNTYPAADCPFRFFLTWSPVCEGGPAGSCVAYQVKISAELIGAPAAGKIATNLEPYRITLIKEDSGPTTQSLCESFRSGPTDTSVYWDPINKVCVFTSSVCVFPLILVGFQANGAAMCGQFQPARCPYNYFMTAMDRGDGSVPATIRCESCDPVLLPPLTLSFGALQ